MGPLLLLALLLAFLLTAWSQVAVRSAFRKYSEVPNQAGLSGAEVASRVLAGGGVADVRIESAEGWLSDHYDPRRRVLRLSPKVFAGRSVAAAGIAAHEAGHAIQDARGYAPLHLRNAAVPTAGLGSSLGFPLLFLGLITGLFQLAVLGLVLFSVVVLFQLITLPVEFDASRRAVQVLASTGVVRTPEEEAGVKTVLTAAAMTYVAAALSGIVWLVYYGTLVLGGRR